MYSIYSIWHEISSHQAISKTSILFAPIKKAVPKSEEFKQQEQCHVPLSIHSAKINKGGTEA